MACFKVHLHKRNKAKPKQIESRVEGERLTFLKGDGGYASLSSTEIAAPLSNKTSISSLPDLEIWISVRAAQE